MNDATNDVIMQGGAILGLGTVGNDLTITGGAVTQGGAIGNNVDVSNAGTLTGNTGAGGNTDITGTLTLQATSGDVIVNDVTGDVTVQGANLTMNDAGADVTVGAAGTLTMRNLGAAGTKITKADFGGDSTVLGTVNVDTINVQNNKIATFKGVEFKGNEMRMNGANAIATFTSRVTMNMPIVANAAGDGIINFNAGVNLTQNIGAAGTRVAFIGFGGLPGGGDSTISANIHSTNITLDNHKFDFTKDVTFDGPTTFVGSTLNLGENDLTMTGGEANFVNATINTTLNALILSFIQPRF
jgi:hypothetical protein